MVKIAAANIFLPLEMSTSKCCNSGTNYDTELKFEGFSYLVDMFMFTINEKILRRWVTKVNNLCCFQMECPFADIQIAWIMYFYLTFKKQAMLHHQNE